MLAQAIHVPKFRAHTIRTCIMDKMWTNFSRRPRTGRFELAEQYVQYIRHSGTLGIERQHARRDPRTGWLAARYWSLGCQATDCQIRSVGHIWAHSIPYFAMIINRSKNPHRKSRESRATPLNHSAWNGPHAFILCVHVVSATHV